MIEDAIVTLLFIIAGILITLFAMALREADRRLKEIEIMMKDEEKKHEEDGRE